MNTGQSHYPDVQWLKARFPAATTVLTSSSRTVQASLCAAGLGVAVLPRLLGDQIAALSRVNLEAAPPGRDIWMGYHQDMRRVDRLRALADIAIDVLQRVEV